MLESRQIRAARALLNWSEEDLANAANVGLTSVQSLEAQQSDVCTLMEVQDAFEKAGVEFLLGNGVRMRKQEVIMLHGAEAYWSLLDDVYMTVMEKGGEVCVLGIDESRVASALDSNPAEGGEKLSRHITRLQKNRISCRKIIREGDNHIIAPMSWYRSIPEEFFSPNPLYIYGGKIGILHFGPPFKAIVYENPAISASLQKFFNFIWTKASPLQLLRQTA
jgi:transcriptional regulator with XRE-family HTH domain